MQCNSAGVKVGDQLEEVDGLKVNDMVHWGQVSSVQILDLGDSNPPTFSDLALLCLLTGCGYDQRSSRDTSLCPFCA
jgi:hypothetical protein